MQFETSEDLCRYMAKRAGGVSILSFSAGKDSIAAWLEMRQYFKTIVPVYMYSIPGLSFIERSLAYYEDFFQTRIIRMPHPALYRMLNTLMLQAPENCATIEAANLPEFDYQEINQIIREDYGLSDEVFAASGVRARDSINRWSAIKKYGPVNEAKKTFYPIFDFNKARMVEVLKAGRVKLPVDYFMFGRSFDGLDYRFLKPIKERYPEDYKKILALFPLAEIELKRIEFREQYYKENYVLEV